MGEKITVLKIQIGQVYIDGKNHPIMIDAWEKKTKAGKKYFTATIPIFVQTVEKKSSTTKQEDLSII